MRRFSKTSAVLNEGVVRCWRCRVGGRRCRGGASRGRGGAGRMISPSGVSRKRSATWRTLRVNMFQICFKLNRVMLTTEGYHEGCETRVTCSLLPHSAHL